MELINRDKRDSYVYDPKIKGFDSAFWSQITGTTTVSSGQLVLNNASMASFGLHEFIEQLDMYINNPTAPTGGQAVRQWGLKAPASNNLGGIYFQTSGATFSAQVFDDSGNNQNVTLTWSSAYTATNTRFSIRWEPNVILFKVNDVILTSFVVSGNNLLPFNALPLFIQNLASDNFTVVYVEVKRAAGIV